MYIQEPHTFYIPNKKIITERKILRKIIRGDEYLYQKEREFNYGKGQRGYQIKLFNKNFIWDHNNDYIKRFCFDNESDVIDFHIEINDPDFNWYKYDINDVEVDKVLLLITQALTANPGTIQNLSVPNTWGPDNTCSCIGGGGSGYQSLVSNTTPIIFTINSGSGGGGGAFASDAIQALDRNSTCNYFIGSVSQATWFKSNTILLADFGTTAGFNVIGFGGLVANCIGAIKRAGGNGGSGRGLTFNSSATQGAATGAGGGGAAGTSAAGSSGTQGLVTLSGDPSLPPPSQPSGSGGNSDTASGGATSLLNGNPGGNGTDFDASNGAGAGAGGGGYTSGASGTPGGNGGNYGGGGGGAAIGAASGRNGGLGNQGEIYLSWVPYQYTEIYSTS